MKGPCYSAPDKTFIRNTFDSISQRYDLLNQILSFGMSEAWRERSADMVLGEADFFPKTILDLGCGSGKFLECFMKRRAWKQAVGLDFSSEMLKKARETVAGNAVWLEQDFDRMPFLESSFDLVISAFAPKRWKSRHFPERGPSGSCRRRESGIPGPYTAREGGCGPVFLSLSPPDPSCAWMDHFG